MAKGIRNMRLANTPTSPSETQKFTKSLAIQKKRNILKRVQSGELFTDKASAKALKDSIAKSSPTQDSELPDFDVIVPYAAPPPGQVSRKWQLMKQNIMNEVKNGTSLYVMMQTQNGIPDFDMGVGWRASLRLPQHLLSTRSIDLHSPLSTIRQQCLQSYIDLFEATFRHDLHKVSDYTSSTYRTLLQKQVGQMKEKKMQTFWQFHKTVTPPRILSMRTTVNPFAGAEGNPNVTQLVMKFDTMQCLERYSKTGHPLHKIAKNHPLHNPIELEKELKKAGNKRQRIPAEPQRVIEYLVMERKWWMYPHWRVRSVVSLEEGLAVKEERWRPFGRLRGSIRAFRIGAAEVGLFPALGGKALQWGKQLISPLTYIKGAKGMRDMVLNVKEGVVLSWYGAQWAWSTGRTLPWARWYREVRVNGNPRYLEQLAEKRKKRQERLARIPGWEWIRSRRG